MSSLFQELADKIAKDPRLTKRSVPKADLSLLLFNSGDALNELWLAASEELETSAAEGRETPARLRAAVEALRPVFGDRER